MLAVGQPAPAFTLPNAEMDAVSLADFARQRRVVLFFYIKDGSPACAQEAIEFTDLLDAFEHHETIVLGISADDCLTHADFRDRHGIGVDLLSDVDSEVCRRYEVMQPRDVNGTIRQCVQRSTFVIDKKGIIRHAQYGVAARGHAREILAVIKRL
ncbi:MAG: peroxiredoxin [Burkholderiales bacterium]